MNFLDMLKVAGTLRVLVIALIAWSAEQFGLAELLPDHNAEVFLDNFLEWATAGLLGLGIVFRIFRPQPSLTQRAADRAVQIGVSAKQVVPADVLQANAKAAKATQANSPWLVGVLAGIVALAVLSAGLLSGCAGTRNAYQAAQATGDKSAYADVIGEQYYATLREANAVKAGGASAEAVQTLQSADRKAGPLVISMLEANVAFKAGRSATSEADLQAAMNKAVVAVNDFIKALKAARGQPDARSKDNADVFGKAVLT